MNDLIYNGKFYDFINIINKRDLNLNKVNEILLDDSSIAFIIAVLITTPFLGTPISLAIGPGSYISTLLFLKILKHVIKYIKEKHRIEDNDKLFLDKIFNKNFLNNENYKKFQQILKKYYF